MTSLGGGAMRIMNNLNYWVEKTKIVEFLGGFHNCTVILSLYLLDPFDTDDSLSLLLVYWVWVRGPVIPLSCGLCER